jgi:hypothetical protein
MCNLEAVGIRYSSLLPAHSVWYRACRPIINRRHLVQVPKLMHDDLQQLGMASVDVVSLVRGVAGPQKLVRLPAGSRKLLTWH